MDFIEDGYELDRKEAAMVKEATIRHSKFYTDIYALNAKLEETGEPVQTVRVMTQNMHARPEPFELKTGAGFVIDTCDPAYNFENRQTDRVINVVKGIKSLPAEIKPHVICFQELQGTKDLIMEKNLTNRKDRFAYGRDKECAQWDIKKDDVTYTSYFGNATTDRVTCLSTSNPKNYPGGLTTYSTLEIAFQTFYIFAVGTGGEQVVNKGVLYSKILISKPDMPETYIHIFNCHPLAPITFDRGECENGLLNKPNNCSIYELRQFQNDQLREIYNFKQSLQKGGFIKKDELVVYAGDMNINQYMALWETDQQKKIETASVCCGEEFYSLLTKLKAEHPPVYLNPLPSQIKGEGSVGGHNGIFTWDGRENSITKSLLWPESYTWIDYVLYSTENAKPMYADNFIVRFQQAEPLYERGKVYQKDCFDKRTRRINELQQKSPISIKTFLDDDKYVFSRIGKYALTHSQKNELTRLQDFQKNVYGTEFIRAVKKDPASFYKNKPYLLKPSTFKKDDNPNNKQEEEGFEYTNTAIEDVSDHYGVIATFILPSTDQSISKFNQLMKNRFDENVRHELFFYLPLQPIVIGINDNGKALRLASRMDPRSPKMDKELWKRQTGNAIQYSSDERLGRAARISSMNATAALNEKIYSVKEKSRLRGKFEYSDCPDHNNAACRTNYSTAFTNIERVRPILRLKDLQDMGIDDIDPTYRYRMREPAQVSRGTNLVGPTPRVVREIQSVDALGMTGFQNTPSYTPQTPRSGRRNTPRRNTPRRK
jgi:hypothetical protein